MPIQTSVQATTGLNLVSLTEEAIFDRKLPNFFEGGNEPGYNVHILLWTTLGVPEMGEGHLFTLYLPIIVHIMPGARHVVTKRRGAVQRICSIPTRLRAAYLSRPGALPFTTKSPMLLSRRKSLLVVMP